MSETNVKSSAVLPECWTLAEQVIGNSDRVLLYGVPGTGKSYQATLYNLKQKQEVLTTTLTEDGSAMELRGHYVPNDNNGMDWIHGTAVQAWLKGARLVLNEIDHASGDVLTFLHNILDDKEFAGMTLPNTKQEQVKPKESFNVVATMNGTPDVLPLALRDRFPVKIHIDRIHPSAIAKLPKKYREACDTLSIITDEDRRTSVRSWFEFSKLVKDMPEHVAAKCVFGSRADDILDTLENLKAKS